MRLVAEAGNCNGDYDYACQVAESLARTGVTMKVQMYQRETLVTPTALRYDHTPGAAANQWELFKDTLSYDAWVGVKAYCQALDVPFFPTVFDPEAVDVAIEQMGCPTLKIASGDVTHLPLIRYAAWRLHETFPNRAELVISTGGATAEEVELAVNTAKAQGLRESNLTLLACHLKYPSTAEEAHLARVLALAHRWPEASVGYSDHVSARFLRGSIEEAGIALMERTTILTALGVDMWEFHYTLAHAQKSGMGDHSFAVLPSQLEAAIEQRQRVYAYMGNVELVPSQGEMDAIAGARRSTFAAHDLPADHKLTIDDLTFLRPGGGLEPEPAVELLVGRKLNRAVEKYESMDTRIVGNVAELTVE